MRHLVATADILCNVEFAELLSVDTHTAELAGLEPGFPKGLVQQRVLQRVSRQRDVSAGTKIEQTLNAIECEAVFLARTEPVAVDGGRAEHRPHTP